MATTKKTTPKTDREFIDAALMERAIKLRKEGKSMKEIGAALGVKATGYLAKKIKDAYGADALAKPTGQGKPQAKDAKPASGDGTRRAARSKSAAKEA